MLCADRLVNGTTGFVSCAADQRLDPQTTRPDLDATRAQDFMFQGWLGLAGDSGVGGTGALAFWMEGASVSWF